MSFDPRRERYLESEIARIQDAKIQTLQYSRTVNGKEKADVIANFLEMNREQEKLEGKLEELQGL